MGVSPAAPLADVAGTSPPSVALDVGLSPLVTGVSVPDVGVSLAEPLADVAGTSPPGVTLTVACHLRGWLTPLIKRGGRRSQATKSPDRLTAPA